MGGAKVGVGITKCYFPVVLGLARDDSDAFFRGFGGDGLPFAAFLIYRIAYGFLRRRDSQVKGNVCNVPSTVCRSNLVMGLFVRRANGMDVSFICVNPILGVFLWVVRRVNCLGVNSSIGQTFRQPSAYNGNQMYVYANEQDCPSDGHEIIASSILYLGRRRGIRYAHVRLNVVTFRRVRGIFNGQRVLLQVAGIWQAPRNNVARRIGDVDGGNQRFQSRVSTLARRIIA